jgi:predicted aldo/keto reductase-like oxidoreductase
MADSQPASRGVSGALVAAAWAVTIVVGYSLGGLAMAWAVEGVDFRLVSKLPHSVILLCIAVSCVLSFRWATGRARARAAVIAHEDATSPSAAPGESADAPDSRALGRRGFLVGAATTVGGVAAVGGAAVVRNIGWATVTGPAIGPAVRTRADAPRPEWAGARVQAKRRLGRTGFEVSDVSLGSSRIRGEQGERVARLAIERGVNYFDTAPDYSDAGSELALGRAMKGQRDRMFLATKFCTPKGHLPAGSSPEAYVHAVEGSLTRLQTDYVDLVHIHSCDTVERLLDPGVHEAFARLKQAGKARFLGFSSHTPNLEGVAAAAIDDGRFDVMMLAYHHGAWPRLTETIGRAAAADVGVVAMKTLKGARHRGLLEDRNEADSYSQAAFKWVLSNPQVACLVISFKELGDVDEYLHASGQLPNSGDYALLEKYDRLNDGLHCHAHCGDCLDSCPVGVPINDVLRHRMYFEDYGDQKEAMRLYRELATNASACESCPAPCAQACTHGVPIPDRLREAHRLLSPS